MDIDRLAAPLGGWRFCHYTIDAGRLFICMPDPGVILPRVESKRLGQGRNTPAKLSRIEQSRGTGLQLVCVARAKGNQ